MTSNGDKRVKKLVSDNNAYPNFGPFADMGGLVKHKDDVVGLSLKPLEANDMERYRIVAFVSGDSENPKNWSQGYKWYITMVVAATCFFVAFASSVITVDVAGVQKGLRVSEELALLTISLFVVGLGLGPMVLAPLSEVLGRRIIYSCTLLHSHHFVRFGTKYPDFVGMPCYRRHCIQCAYDISRGDACRCLEN